MEKLEYKSIRNEPTQRGMKRKMGVARDIRLYGIPIQEQFSFKTA
jgi:hypothetical protein